MTYHKLSLNSHKLFNYVYSKGYIELKGHIKYNVGDTIKLVSTEDNSTSEGYLNVYKVKYDAINNITFIDFKRDRTIERNKSIWQLIKDFIRGY
jgi:hypothetical protein